jgi:hypothetical protein
VRRKVGTSASGSYRPDFRVLHADGSSTVLETKQAGLARSDCLFTTLCYFATKTPIGDSR